MAQALCPIVVGRDRELELLAERLSTAREGSGTVVFLVGEAGIGKSRLTREAEARAAELGMWTLRGRAVQAGAPVPFRPLAEALRPALREALPDGLDATASARVRPVFARLAPETVEDAADLGEESPLLLLEALAEFVASLASGRGLLLTLEDLHWADADTLAAVEYLADHVGSVPVLCLCTVRSDEPGPALHLAELLDARRAALRIRLGRLSEEEVDEMVRATAADREPPSAVLEAVRMRAEGVPFVAEEMVSAYLAAGTVPGDERWVELVLPDSYRELVRARLAMLDHQARRVVFAAAVLGSRFDWSLAGVVAGMEAPAVLDALRDAVASQLVQTTGGGPTVAFRFRHALVREAVLHELLPPERAELSLRAADVIEGRFPGLPGEWCERAADLREIGDDPRGAARLLMEAGRRALARSALATAEATLERAVRLASTDHWLEAGIEELLLETSARAGKVDRVRELGDRVRLHFAGRSTFYVPQRLAPVHLRIARGLATAGDWPLARTHLELARELAGSRGVERLRAEIAAFGAELALAEGDLDEAMRAATESIETGERLAASDVLFEALEVRGRAAFRAGDAEGGKEDLTRAVLVASRPGLALWRARALLTLGTVERCTTGEPGRLLEARDVLAGTEAVATQALVELEIGRALTARFELEGALEALSRCVDACRRYRLPLLPHGLVALAVLLGLLGRVAEADALLGEAIDEGGHDIGLLADAWGEGRAVEALLRGERTRANKALEAGRLQLERAPAGDPRWFPGLWCLMRTVENFAAADARARVASSPHATHVVTGAYLALAEAVDRWRKRRRREAATRFAEADAALVPFPWHRHLGRLAVAEAAARGRWGDPVVWMRETLSFFDGAGHHRLADACKRVLRLAGAPVPRKGRGDSAVPPELRVKGVTSREMDVLTLVAQGLSNREVGRRLYLSPRTVETHVASLMRKTGVQTREALAGVARSSGAH